MPCQQQLTVSGSTHTPVPAPRPPPTSTQSLPLLGCLHLSFQRRSLSKPLSATGLVVPAHVMVIQHGLHHAAELPLLRGLTQWHVTFSAVLCIGQKCKGSLVSGCVGLWEWLCASIPRQ